MGVADVELVDQRARLVGVDDDHFAGRVGAGEDPHSAVHAVCLLELLRLRGGRWTDESDGDEAEKSIYYARDEMCLNSGLTPDIEDKFN